MPAQPGELARTTYVIDSNSIQGRIEPRWFGHNLEHTRSSVWHGLAAQILRNRKFAGKAQQVTGQAMEWYAIGPRQTCFLLDTDGAYTRHYDPRDTRRRNQVQCQRIQGYLAEQRSGLGQNGLPLLGGQAYQLRLALHSSQVLPVQVAILRDHKHAGGQYYAYHETTLEVFPGDWRLYPLEFTMPETDGAARLEITFDGIGELAVGAASLLPANHWHGMRPDVIAALQDIGTPLLRWPGGNFAGDYRWQDGLLDVDQRAPLAAFMEMETLPHTHGFDMHEIGIDEYIALCRELGAEPFISINLAWESPAQSAAWVEYCNVEPGSGEDKPWARLRAERGHPEPYNVKAWSLGNELGYGHMEGPNTPRAYADKAAACAGAMKAVDPTLELVSSGTWQREEWFTDGLVPLGPVIEHISHHSYTPQLRRYAGAQAIDELRALIAAPARDFAVLREIRQGISAYAPQGRFIGISFDEWNVWYAWYRRPGVAEGLYAAMMLNRFCREARDVGMTIGCYFEPVNEGAIIVEPDRVTLTPVGQAMRLFRAHHGRTAVEVAPPHGEQLVDVSASMDPSTERLLVTMVNVTPDQPLRVPLDLRGIDRPQQMEGRLLYGDDILPGSVLHETNIVADLAGDGSAEIALPAYSVALVEFAPGRHAAEPR